jgi:hypothetical protein
MKGHAEGFATPLRQTALLALIVLEPFVKKSSLEMGASGLGSSDNKQIVNWHPCWPWLDRTSLYCRVPRAQGKSKSPRALAYGHTTVVRLLDLVPIITTPTIVTGRNSKPARVIRDRRLREPQPSPHLRLRQPLAEHFPDQCPFPRRR